MFHTLIKGNPLNHTLNPREQGRK